MNNKDNGGEGMTKDDQEERATTKNEDEDKAETKVRALESFRKGAETLRDPRHPWGVKKIQKISVKSDGNGERRAR